jgi:ABC-type multidrug transport system permease subunit
MKNSKLIMYAIVHSVGASAYIAAVSWILFNAGKIFGTMNNFLAPLMLLLLFVLSATIVGLLILGRPAYLYFNGLKPEGVRLLFYTVGCFLFITVLIFATYFLTK